MTELERSAIPSIYALADRETLSPRTLADSVAQMVDAGLRWIQIRSKNSTDAELARDVEAVLLVTEGSGARIWINDRPDLARMFAAYGVHLGQDDVPCRRARETVLPDTKVGLSTHSLNQAKRADRDSAVDLIAIGPVFATSSKLGVSGIVGLRGVRAVRSATTKPLIAIGGIDASNMLDVLDHGADSVAILGAVCRGEVGANCARLVARMKFG